MNLLNPMSKIKKEKKTDQEKLDKYIKKWSPIEKGIRFKRKYRELKKKIIKSNKKKR